MNKRNKKFLILSVAVVSILLLVGITYALNYTQTGTNQKMILGDIWMNYRESNGINLENVVPGADYSDYFEFTIEGTNTYTKKDIWYEVLIARGDRPQDKSEANRILDKFLLFKLVEVNGESETVIFKDKSYSNLNNQRVYVETIGKGVSNYSKTYRLYATLSDELVIGNTVDSDLDFDEFAQAFASIKVNVTGDFNEKELVTDVECFNAVKIIDSYTYNNSDEAVNKCAAYIEQQGFYVGQTSYEDYCRGTDSSKSLENEINQTLRYDSTSDILDMNLAKSDINYFIDNNIITDIVYGAAIVGYDETCGSEVIVPNTIGSYPVTSIYGAHYYSYDSDYSDYGLLNFGDLTSNKVVNLMDSYEETAGIYQNFIGAFYETGLTNLELPNSIKYIGLYAFQNNSLTNIIIPNSVATISSSAFSLNNLETVVIGKGIEFIGAFSFAQNTNLRSITIDKTCSDIRTFDYYPGSSYAWVDTSTITTDLTIFGKNSEVCDTITVIPDGEEF